MSSEQTTRIALVGHCGPDAYALKSAVMGFVPGASIELVGSQQDFEDRVAQFDLHLVNRVLDGSFPNTSGIDLIARHHADHPPMMLISNYPESLQEAVEAGAVMGFGKRAMRSEEARIALHNALGTANTTNEG